jgi:hypothetical protein
MVYLQYLCAVDELCIPAFVGPDEMWEVVDDMDTMFDKYHLTIWLCYCFNEPAFILQSIAIFFGTMIL